MQHEFNLALHDSSDGVEMPQVVTRLELFSWLAYSWSIEPFWNVGNSFLQVLITAQGMRFAIALHGFKLEDASGAACAPESDSCFQRPLANDVIGGMDYSSVAQFCTFLSVGLQLVLYLTWYVCVLPSAPHASLQHFVCGFRRSAQAAVDRVEHHWRSLRVLRHLLRQVGERACCLRQLFCQQFLLLAERLAVHSDERGLRRGNGISERLHPDPRPRTAKVGTDCHSLESTAHSAGRCKPFKSDQRKSCTRCWSI